jgi:hypothetical protein
MLLRNDTYERRHYDRAKAGNSYEVPQGNLVLAEKLPGAGYRNAVETRHKHPHTDSGGYRHPGARAYDKQKYKNQYAYA